MATVFVIWSRKDRKIVPSPDTNYASSQAANDAVRRLVKNTGDTKDHQNQTFDVVSMTV